MKIAVSTDHFWETVASLTRRRLSEGHGYGVTLQPPVFAHCKVPPYRPPAPHPPLSGVDLNKRNWSNTEHEAIIIQNKTTTVIQSVLRLEYTEQRSLSRAFSWRSLWLQGCSKPPFWKRMLREDPPGAQLDDAKSFAEFGWTRSHLRKPSPWVTERPQRHEVSLTDAVEMFCFPVIASLRFGGWFSHFKVSSVATRHQRGRGAHPFNVAAVSSHQESAETAISLYLQRFVFDSRLLKHQGSLNVWPKINVTELWRKSVAQVNWNWR